MGDVLVLTGTVGLVDAGNLILGHVGVSSRKVGKDASGRSGLVRQDYWRSPLRGKWIVAVAVLRLDLAIAPMNHELCMLVLRGLARPVDGVGLAVESFGGPRRSGATDGPLIGVRNNVLVALRHRYLFLRRNCRSCTYAERLDDSDMGRGRVRIWFPLRTQRN